MRRMPWLGAWTVATLIAWPVSAQDQDPPTLDELLDLEPDTEQADPSPPPPPPEGDTPEADATQADAATGDDDVADALSMDEAAGVFEQAVAEMDGVARRLGPEADPGLDTQRRQREILRKLDQIIAAARQQQGQSSSSSSSSARQQDPGSQQLPGQRSQSAASARPGGDTASRGDASPGSVGSVAPGGELEELRREWGSLPPRLRDELTEGLSEPFSPVYRELTERFYRRLGEAQSP